MPCINIRQEMQDQGILFQCNMLGEFTFQSIYMYVYSPGDFLLLKFDYFGEEWPQAPIAETLLQIC